MPKGRVWLGAAVLAAGVAMLALAVVATRDSGPAAATTPTPSAATPTATVAASPTVAPTPESLVCTDAALGETRAANPALAADCDALLGLRDALAGDASLNWRADRPMTQWEGVAIDVKPRRVVSLWLTREGLTGALPPALGQLTHLVALGAGHNRLTGPIPSELGELTRLTLLHLNDNQLTGRIPPTLRRLTQLQQLWLHRNRLEGPVPASLRRLVKLTELNLHTNRLSGALPWQLGALPELTYLNLHTNRFSGELPPELGQLDPLYQLWLGGNGFTGCAPGGLWKALRHDLDATGLPNCAEPPPLRYGAPEPGGIVDAPGEYAFFSNDGPATTYEGLRQDVEQLVIHQRDADGASWEEFYAGVEAGDDFEWREADDCWVRYLVDEVLPDPTDAPLKVLAVRRYGYAYTGCSGAVPATGDRMWNWEPPNIQSPDITVPVRHGPWLLVPQIWEDTVEEQVQVRTWSVDRPVAGQGLEETNASAWPPHPLPEPTLPDGWEGGIGMGDLGYIEGYYSDTRGYLGVIITILLRYFIPAYEFTGSGVGQGNYVHETRIIEGLPAFLWYLAEPKTITSNGVSIFDPSSGIEYIAEGYAESIRNDIEATIIIAKSLLPVKDGVVEP